MRQKPSDFLQPRLIEKLKTVIEVNYPIAVALLNFAGNLGFILENHEVFEGNEDEDIAKIDIHKCQVRYIQLVNAILALTPQEIADKLKNQVPHLHASNLDMYDRVEVITQALKK